MESDDDFEDLPLRSLISINDLDKGVLQQRIYISPVAHLPAVVI